MTKRKPIDYRCALVTGASSGIGAAIATELCLNNIMVLAVARNKAGLTIVKSALPNKKQKFFKIIVADITKDSDITKIVSASKKAGGVDLLINNAGIGVSKSFEEHESTDVNSIISTNLIGTINLTHRLLVSRSAKKSMHIVFVSSLAGKIGFPDLSIYSASKFALEGLAESLRHEYAKKPVRITVLRPGVTDTNFFHTAGMDSYYQSVSQSNKIHTPQSVAKKLIAKLDTNNGIIMVGGDRFFLRVLPLIPFRKRFKILDYTNIFQ